MGNKTQKTQVVPARLCTIESDALEVQDVALGQDHTVLVTSHGLVYTFGGNQHGQLGYTLDRDISCQSVPKRIPNLKDMIGVAASNTHSVAYTMREVYIWGANNGQLGKDK